MELLAHVNKLRFKDSTDLLPTLYALSFSYCLPQREVVIFTLGTATPESFNRGRTGIAASIDVVHGNIRTINDGDDFRVVCRTDKIFIVKNVTFLNDDKSRSCQNIMAEDIIEVI